MSDSTPFREPLAGRADFVSSSYVCAQEPTQEKGAAGRQAQIRRTV